MQPSTLYCTSCGAGNRPTSTFCFSCGQKIQVGILPAPAPGPTPVAAPTPPQPTPNNMPISMTGWLPLNHLLKQRYAISNMVGQGGMGAVYKATDLQFGTRTVAIKEMSQSKLDPQEAANAVEQFKQEAHLLAGLKHPNLPSIYDHFGENGRWYLVMDFIEGTTLEKYIEQFQGNPVPVNAAFEIGIQLTKVLGYLHTRPTPIIFRDLKPLNVMRTPDGHLYLIDFGIARLFKQGQAKDTNAYGSFGYAPPEQFGHTQTTPQSDIYSLGATLHRLFSGHLPEHNKPMFQFQPLRTYKPAIPISLDNLVASMVDINENKRPASMAVVRQQLEEIQQQQTPIPPTVYPQAKMIQPSSSSPSFNKPAPSIQPQLQQLAPTPAKQIPRYGLLIALITGVMINILNIPAYFGFRPFGEITILLYIPIASFIVSMIVGRAIVTRWRGFLIGGIAGLLWTMLHYGYYTYYSDSTYIWQITIVGIVVCLIAGGLSMLGTWLVARNHPYYRPALSAQPQLQQPAPIPAKPIPRYGLLIALIAGVMIGIAMYIIVHSTSPAIFLLYIPIASFIVSMIIGKTIVTPWRGFLIGGMAGLPLMTLAIYFSSSYYSSYRNEILMVGIIGCLIAGNLSMLGTWIVAQNHPYYKKNDVTRTP